MNLELSLLFKWPSTELFQGKRLFYNGFLHRKNFACWEIYVRNSETRADFAHTIEGTNYRPWTCLASSIGIIIKATRIQEQYFLSVVNNPDLLVVSRIYGSGFFKKATLIQYAFLQTFSWRTFRDIRYPTLNHRLVAILLQLTRKSGLLCRFMAQISKVLFKTGIHVVAARQKLDQSKETNDCKSARFLYKLFVLLLNPEVMNVYVLTRGLFKKKFVRSG